MFRIISIISSVSLNGKSHLVHSLLYWPWIRISLCDLCLIFIPTKSHLWNIKSFILLLPMDLQTEQTFCQRPFILLSFPISRPLCFALSFFLLSVSSLFIFNFSSTPFNHQYYDLLRFHHFLSTIFPENKPSSSPSPSPGACDYSNGKWVWDETYPFHTYTENCPFVDPGFQCSHNGRKDEGYRKWRWQPDGCDLPRYAYGCRLLVVKFLHGFFLFVLVYCSILLECFQLIWEQEFSIQISFLLAKVAVLICY